MRQLGDSFGFSGALTEPVSANLAEGDWGLEALGREIYVVVTAHYFVVLATYVWTDEA
jgi:hypothetical protein